MEAAVAASSGIAGGMAALCLEDYLDEPVDKPLRFKDNAEIYQTMERISHELRTELGELTF